MIDLVLRGGTVHVLVSGQQFLAGGEWTGAFPGRVLGAAAPATPPGAERERVAP